MDTNYVYEIIRNIIIENVIYDPTILDADKIEIDENYIEYFSVSSIEFITILLEIENTFKIEFDSDMILMEQLNTIEKIGNIIFRMENEHE